MNTLRSKFNQELAEAVKPRSAMNMDCPVCHVPMKRGTTSLEHTFWGFFMAGWSMLTLFFRAPGRKRFLVMNPDDSRVSYLCPSCEGLFIGSANTYFPPESDSPHSCADCGITLRPGHTDCHWCGWRPETKTGKTPKDRHA